METVDDKEAAEAREIAQGFAALRQMGQLGAVNPYIARSMIDTMSAYPDEVERAMPLQFDPTDVRAGLMDAYESDVVRYATTFAQDSTAPRRAAACRERFERMSRLTGRPPDELMSVMMSHPVDRDAVNDKASLYRI